MKKLSAPDIDVRCVHSVVKSMVKSFQVRSKYVIARQRRPSYDRAELLIHFSAYKRNFQAGSQCLNHPAKFVA